mmetsp:Transcript_93158/g.154039  ORF Transcript_93158/g.154039 Transcript_93158/m.154039 type:complete len:97 (+) Transcript_93158:418-708(+)
MVGIRAPAHRQRAQGAQLVSIPRTTANGPPGATGERAAKPVAQVVSACGNATCKWEARVRCRLSTCPDWRPKWRELVGVMSRTLPSPLEQVLEFSS